MSAELNEHGTPPNPFRREGEEGELLILPIGVSLRQMLAMISELQAALGKENVLLEYEHQATGDVFQGQGGGAGAFADAHDFQPGSDKVRLTRDAPHFLKLTSFTPVRNFCYRPARLHRGRAEDRSSR